MCHGRRKSKGVKVVWAANHGGMIKGIYIRDPAGNVCELFVDDEHGREVRERLAAGESISAPEQQDLPAYALDLRSDLGVEA